MFAVLVPLKRPDRAKTRLAKSGVAEHQRLAVAFAWDTVAAALGSPLVAIIMLLFIISVTVHMRIGMQVIIEDYVHDESAKLTLIMANTFFAVAVALACAFGILKLAFGV